MRRKGRSRSPDRRDAKQRLLKPDTSELDILSAVEHRVLELRSVCLGAPVPEIYIEPYGYDQPLGATQPNSNTSLDAPDLPTKPLMTMAYEFLDSTNTVLLLMGDPGSGKTVFVKQLERKLWGEYNGLSDVIPILVNLSEFTKPANDLLGQVLQSRGFHPDHIQVLKRNKRRFILICDGYDEAQVQVNIYNQNRFNREGQWIVKLIIACRSDKIGRDSDGRFQPEVDDRYSSQRLNQFQKAATASFTLRQITEYFEKYVANQLQMVVRQSSGVGQELIQNNSSEDQPWSQPRLVWTVSQYMETLTDIPDLIELVKNPCILSFILERLPEKVGSPHDVFRSKVFFDELYKYIFDRWIDVAKRRLRSRAMTEDENLDFMDLLQYDFADSCMKYMRCLVVEILRNQTKASPVQCTIKEEAMWRTRCLGTDTKVSLLQENRSP